MKILKRRPFVLLLALALAVTGTLWVTSTVSARQQSISLPSAGTTTTCLAEQDSNKETLIAGLGTFHPFSTGTGLPMVIVTGKPFVRNGLKTIPFRLIANGGQSFAEGIGETRFWLDATRPLAGAVWEKRPGTEFPAIQESRFHFFYTVEAMPGRVFRTINPAIMRSDNVRSWPPPPGTVYRLMQRIDLEDVADPGVVVVQILSNRVEIKPPKPLAIPRWNGD